MDSKLVSKFFLLDKLLFKAHLLVNDLLLHGSFDAFECNVVVDSLLMLFIDQFSLQVSYFKLKWYIIVLSDIQLSLKIINVLLWCSFTVKSRDLRSSSQLGFQRINLFLVKELLFPSLLEWLLDRQSFFFFVEELRLDFKVRFASTPAPAAVFFVVLGHVHGCVVAEVTRVTQVVGQSRSTSTVIRHPLILIDSRLLQEACGCNLLLIGAVAFKSSCAVLHLLNFLIDVVDQVFEHRDWELLILVMHSVATKLSHQIEKSASKVTDSFLNVLCVSSCGPNISLAVSSWRESGHA